MLASPTHRYWYEYQKDVQPFAQSINCSLAMKTLEDLHDPKTTFHPFKAFLQVRGLGLWTEVWADETPSCPPERWKDGRYSWLDPSTKPPWPTRLSPGSKEKGESNVRGGGGAARSSSKEVDVSACRGSLSVGILLARLQG